MKYRTSTRVITAHASVNAMPDGDDGTKLPPVLNANDFLCFINVIPAGCT